MLYVLFLAEKLKERLTRIFAEKLLGETPCKLKYIYILIYIEPNFPAKKLSLFSSRFFKKIFYLFE